MNKYLYCILDSGRALEFENRGVGQGDKTAPVRTLSFKGLGAVISDVSNGELTPSRENFLTHQLVLEEAMRGNTILPLRFGTVAKSEKGIARILENHYSEFKELLEKLKGKKELGVKALWEKHIIFQEVIEENRDIKELRDKLLRLPPEKTHYQRVEIGRMVEAALEAKREKEGQEILECLKRFCLDYKVNQLISERMILNAAFLVDDQLEKEFDRKINELAAQHQGRVTFRYVGPVPPYNFVSLKIDLQELAAE